MRSIVKNHVQDRGGCRRRSTSAGAIFVLAGFGILAGSSSVLTRAQDSGPQHPPHPILLPQANHLPDVNDQMIMKEQEGKAHNFDAANALRQQQIADDTVKLLILTRDLKAQIEKLGNRPLPPSLIREAEVIELLAHDVEKRMTLTIGAG